MTATSVNTTATGTARNETAGTVSTMTIATTRMLEIRTTRYGEMETVHVSEDTVLAFPEGVPGFERHRRFALIEDGNDGRAFPVAPPGVRQQRHGGAEPREAAIMLVLSRRPGQSILIGKDIEVVVLGSDGVQVRVGIRAPREVTVLRRELLKQVEEENRRASSGAIGVSVASLGAALGQIGGELNGRGVGTQAEVGTPLAEPEKVRQAGAA